ncbi:MAG: DUF192 domain-containing protein [Candidatus Moraniibacteriota bacterium]|nr:MAG: DUF192 domain-containing protein [Candidatus Moranbacteria bacterium]
MMLYPPSTRNHLLFLGGLATVGIVMTALVQSRFETEFDAKASDSLTHAVTYGHIWRIDVANTEALRSRGLGGRDSYPSGRGMLFVFDAPYQYGFWMKGMRFPIDIVFLLRGQVVFVERGIRPEDERVVTPPTPVDQVIEFSAGGAEDISVGNRVWYWRGF